MSTCPPLTSRAGRDQLLALVLPDPDLVGHRREPVAAGATFVVNAEDEIGQAIKDYGPARTVGKPHH